jgi:hypothetical protein
MTTIADKLIEYLKTYGDRRIKEYYYGDPLVIPVSSMPALIIENRGVGINQGATGLDEISPVYAIKLVMSKKDELGKTANEMACQRTLADILMKRNSDNNYFTTSIIGILRKYFTLGQTINDQEIAVEFFTAARGDLITEELELIINIKDFVSMPSRQ